MLGSRFQTAVGEISGFRVWTKTGNKLDRSGFSNETNC